MATEKSFPRGGNKPAITKSPKTSTFSLFNKAKSKTKLSKYKKKNGHNLKDLKTTTKTQPVQKILKAKYVDSLLQVVQEGMLVFGIVQFVTEKKVYISLPDGLTAIANLGNISELYTNCIKNGEEVPGLPQIFKIGDFVNVKVISACEEKNKTLFVTLDPAEVHSKVTFRTVMKGMILSGIVKSIEEYGYIVENGVSNVNSFLHKDKVGNSIDLQVGQYIRCAVIATAPSEETCNVQLSMLPGDINSGIVTPGMSLPLHACIPGQKFKVTVSEVLSNGLEVHFKGSQTFKGYIHEEHLLKLFDSLGNYQKGSNVIATLTYIKPLVNALYFKLMPKKIKGFQFQDGQIVSGKMVRACPSGVVFKIGGKSSLGKCVVPFGQLGKSKELTDENGKLQISKLDKNKAVKIRLGKKDLMGRYFVGTTDKESIKDKYYSLFDLKCGQVVTGTITSLEPHVKVLIGKTMIGVVDYRDLTNIPLKNPKAAFTLGQRVKARVLEVRPDSRWLRLTMKPDLVQSTDTILSSFEQAKRNESYLGTVVSIQEEKLLVLFYNGVMGSVKKYNTPFSNQNTLVNHYYEGQVLKCYVLGAHPERKRLWLSLLGERETNKQLEMGIPYSAKVISSDEQGLMIEVTLKNFEICKGRIPSALLTENDSLVDFIHTIYSPKDSLKACYFIESNSSVPLFTICKSVTNLYKKKSSEELKELMKVDCILPFVVEKINKESLFLQHLIPGFRKIKVIVTSKNICDGINPNDLKLRKYQVLYGKILSISSKEIRVSTKLSDCWDRGFETSFCISNSYLNEMRKINEKKGENFSMSRLGKKVKGIVEKVTPEETICKLKNGDQAVVFGQVSEGQKISGKIVWIDGPKEIIYINVMPDCVEDIIGGEDEKQELHGQKLKSRVVHISEDLLAVALKGRGKGKLAFVPRRRHVNDFRKTPCCYKLGDIAKLYVERRKPNNLLAIDHKIVLIQEKVIWDKHTKKSKKLLKRKLNEAVESEKECKNSSKTEDTGNEEIEVVNVKLGNQSKKIKLEVESEEENVVTTNNIVDLNDKNDTNNTNNTNNSLFDEEMDIKSEGDSLEDANQSLDSKAKGNKEKIDLSSSSESEEEDSEKIPCIKTTLSVGFNWDAMKNPSLLSGIMLNKQEEDSTDEEPEESKGDKKKRRRLTKNERQEKAKSEEQRLRYFEEQLMDTNREPQTVDDFDRLVLSKPDSSAVWLQYMAFHLQETEIEKARNVARRALKSISFREEQERLNIWSGLLNLENLYGTDESLKQTLDEALQCNEPYKIHLHMLNLHAQSNRFQEMEKLGHLMLRKYKDVDDVWGNVASTYYQVGKLESARNILQKALASLDKKKHVEVIVKFAHLENRVGDSERAQTLYETILSSFPKRIDIWSSYIDMIIKSNNIELARQVLERAISQQLPPRKMKTLFKKFLTFEETYGTPENVEKVRESAVEYVQMIGTIAN